jgi:hypothetical protein
MNRLSCLMVDRDETILVVTRPAGLGFMESTDESVTAWRRPGQAARSISSNIRQS